MHNSISKMEGSYQQNIRFPKYAHSAIICGQTGCRKTVFVLDLLENEYRGVFENIVILCPTIEWNKAYKSRAWIKYPERPIDSRPRWVLPPSWWGRETLTR